MSWKEFPAFCSDCWLPSNQSERWQPLSQYFCCFIRTSLSCLLLLLAEKMTRKLNHWYTARYEWDQVGLSRASLVCSYWVRKKPGSSKHVRLFALIHLLWSTRDLKTKMAQGRNHGKNFKAQSHSICRLIAHSTGFEPTVSTVNIHTSIKGWPGGRWHGGVKRPLRGQSLKDSCTLSTSAWWWW